MPATPPTEDVSGDVNLQEFKLYEAEDPVQVAVSRHVYIDLLQARQWCRLRVYHCKPLQLVYLLGKEKPHSSWEPIVPIPAHIELSMARIQEIFKHVKLDLKDEVESAESLTFAIVDSDSTTVMYRMHEGLRAPPEDEFIDAQKPE